MELHYWKYKLGIPISNRDFICIRRVIEYEDGSVLVIERSINDDRAPKDSKCVRCNLFFQLRKIFPADDDGVVKMITANQTDIGGSIPKSVTNSQAVKVTTKEIEHIIHVASEIEDETVQKHSDESYEDIEATR